MNMARLSPGLVLPSIAAVPLSYTRVQGDDSALSLACSVVQLGLGSPEIWTRSNGAAQFIKAAINQWLDEQGAGRLLDRVNIDFAIVDELEDNQPEKNDHFFILLETNDGCGYLEVGKAIARLETVDPGLGVSFYVVLMDTMWHWMYAYDVSAAEYFYERWKESIEMELEYDDRDEDSGSESPADTFNDYCKTNGVDFPNLREAIPSCLRDLNFSKERKRLKRHVAVLEQHKRGPAADLIAPVLTMAAISHRRKARLEWLEIAGIWDDPPLPNWIVAFDAHDPITQAFDEDAQSMRECSHAPCWIDTFDPADARDVYRVLTSVRDFLTVNLQMLKVADAAAALAKKGKSDAGTSADQFHPELRAA